MFAATLILASYFAVPITWDVLLRPKIVKRRMAVRVIVSAQPDT